MILLIIVAVIVLVILMTMLGIIDATLVEGILSIGAAFVS